MKGKKTSQTKAEQVKALAPIYDSASDLARELNMPPQTVRDIIKRDDEFVELRAQQKREMILKAHKVARDLLNEMGGMKAKSLAEATMSYGILIDKTAKLAGEDSRWAYQQVNMGNQNIVLQVTPNVKKIMEKIKKDK